jgi:hypothetical protein
VEDFCSESHADLVPIDMLKSGNELNGAAVSVVHDSVQHDMSVESGSLYSKFHIGNSSKNINRELLNGETNPCFNNVLTQSHVDSTHQEVTGKIVPEKPTVTPVKRSKRREGSVDEDLSSRAERLKAKRNLDALGMSMAKSFLLFSNEKIKSSFRSLGISDETNIDRGIDNIKNLEYQRFLETPQQESENLEINNTERMGLSDMDSDFEMDHQAIKNLNGDIAMIHWE